MSLEEQITPFPWSRYSKKMAGKIDRPLNSGFFDLESSDKRGVRLAVGREGAIEEGNLVAFYWLVDRDDGTIIDARYQIWGQTALLGAAEAACALIVGKNYDQAKRISADLIDKQVRDRADTPAFPKETYPHLNLVLAAIEEAAEKCSDIPLPTSYAAPPAPMEIGEVLEGGYPGWGELSLKQKLTVLEEVMDNEIRPYIAMDGGGVEVLNLIGDKEVVIAYQGNCTSCFSAVGATLSYIQQVVQARVHPDLVVVPNLDPVP